MKFFISDPKKVTRKARTADTAANVGDNDLIGSSFFFVHIRLTERPVYLRHS